MKKAEKNWRVVAGRGKLMGQSCRNLLRWPGCRRGSGQPAGDTRLCAGSQSSKVRLLEWVCNDGRGVSVAPFRVCISLVRPQCYLHYVSGRLLAPCRPAAPPRGGRQQQLSEESPSRHSIPFQLYTRKAYLSLLLFPICFLLILNYFSGFLISLVYLFFIMVSLV